MIRSIATAFSLAFAMALAATQAGAGELMDCYNDKVDADSRYTSVTPEVLQVTDADIEKMLAEIRAHEQRASMLARSDAGEPAAQAASD